MTPRNGSKSGGESRMQEIVTYMKKYSLNKEVKRLLSVVNPLLARKETNIRVHLEALKDCVITEDEFRTIEAKIQLGRLCLDLEKLIPKTRVTLLFYDQEENRIYHGAAPSIPVEFFDFFETINEENLLDENCGSCGRAIYSKTVAITDIATDPVWQPFKEHAFRYGFRSCWSVPFFREEQVLGTFAIYSWLPLVPTRKQIRLIKDRVVLYRDAIFRVSHELTKKEA
ncbi:GAF domain-containing protein [Paenibacillus sp.]|uniref:GAF domain-containing protein n=1 Tax=Paenibacillus sp. TaxID=58172 RepID=UPI002D530804|nr:GAF domain-containing protein [Paenibacillus sp.]HZG85145.1 GAF domain-containing protein [Paenibacillus sp.]